MLSLLLRCSFISIILLLPCISFSAITIKSTDYITVTLIGYTGLTSYGINTDVVQPHKPLFIDDYSYKGLAILKVHGGMSCPILLGKDECTIQIAGSTGKPDLSNCLENRYFSSSLHGEFKENNDFPTANTLLMAKKLHDSCSSVKTLSELKSKRIELCTFVSDNYHILKNSTMVQRLISRSYMMHEWVNYQQNTMISSDMQSQFETQIMENTSEWIIHLKTHISTQILLNHIIGLYYKRSMITLGSTISLNFASYAYCEGIQKDVFVFPKALLDNSRNSSNKEGKVLSGNSIVSFISPACPVSLVSTVKKARELASEGEDKTILVVPLEKLNSDHRSIRRLLTQNNLIFFDNDEWREKNLPETIRLPLIIPLQTD